MEFCPRCGSFMMPTCRGSETFLSCRRCGFVKHPEPSMYKDVKSIVHGPKEGIIVVEGELQALPKVRAECKKCGNLEAYWWILQTRSADEPPTRFYRCTKCGCTWREYE